MSYQGTALPLLRSQEKTDEPSVSSTIERVLDAGERVIIDRIELMRLDAHETVARTVRGAALLALGGALLCGGWFAAMAIIVLVLDAYNAPAFGYAIVACLSVVAGVALVVLGMQRLPNAPTRIESGPCHE